jgi:hypothetical protein
MRCRCSKRPVVDDLGDPGPQLRSDVGDRQMGKLMRGMRWTGGMGGSFGLI